MMRFIVVFLSLLNFAVGVSAQSSGEDCIAIMGDSLPAGTFVAMLPGTGVTVVQGERISYLLDDALQDANLLQYGIYDLSLGASSLAAPGHEPYLTSRELFVGQTLNCQFVVVFPFLNDLYKSDDTEDGISLYANGIGSLVGTMREGSPDSMLILMEFYPVTLQGAGDLTYGGDVSREHVAALNEVHSELCQSNVLVHCLDTADVLNPVSESVVGAIDQADFENAGYIIINPDEADLPVRFWANTPNAPIFGDGLHWNPAGQATIIEALMALFGTLDPVNFAPLFE